MARQQPAEHKELEIKLELAPAGVPRLAQLPLIRAAKRKPRRTRETSVYFDTGKHKLRRNGVVLRVRRIGRRHIQTIKASNPHLFSRDEWETELAGAAPDLRCARGTALAPLLTRKLRKKLKPVFETEVERMVYPLGRRPGAIELAVDRGRIETGVASAPLCELELELKRGDEAELFAVARKLSHALPAQLAFKSKPERGYELIDGVAAAPVKRVAAALAAGVSTRDAFRAIGRACLKQIVHNAPPLLRGDAEGVHQMRVGLRRLRAAMALFADLIRNTETSAIKRELRWLAGELAPAREMQVLIEHVTELLKHRHGNGHVLDHGVPLLSSDLRARCEAARERAQQCVGSERFRALTLDVAAWLEAGRWAHPPDDLVRRLAEQPAKEFAAEELTRRLRKVRKTGPRLAGLDARRRHKLRIRVKKLRYAGEFFAELFPGKGDRRRYKRFSRALGRLQDGLGDLNDIVVEENLLAEAGLRRRNRGRRAFAAGLLAGQEDARFAAAMRAATKGYAKLAKTKAFWR